MPPVTGREEWRPVVGYEGLYEVSSEGAVKSLKFKGWNRKVPRILKPRPGNAKGYLRVDLARFGHKKRPAYIHTLVLEAFVGPRPKGCEARHLNDVFDDNRIENLGWGTRAQNMQDAVKNGRTQRGEKHWNACLSRVKVDHIFALRAQGLTQREIAAQIGIVQPQVFRILAGKRWSGMKKERQGV